MLAALSAGKAILIGVGAGLFVVVLGLAATVGLRRPRKAAGPDIPAGMRPGPSDAALEKPNLEKLLASGAVLTLFMSIWIPMVFLQEPATNKADTQDQIAASVERGRQTTLPGSEANPLGFNCVRCHGPGMAGGQNVFNGAVIKTPNITTVCGGAAYGHPLITNLQDVINTIAMGRPPTDMPSWSVRFAGAMDDQQINDLINYILSIQKVPLSKNICVNPAKT
jgi:mono/diheme cytochrome c family protein